MLNLLLAPAMALCVTSMVTIFGARVVDRARRNLPLPLWLFLVSLSAPLAWIAFQGLTLVIILHGPHADGGGFGGKWPSYLREVLFGIGWKLWIFGAICTAVLAFYRRGSAGEPVRNAKAYKRLFYLGGGSAAAVMLPLAMDHWIDTGQLNGAFLLINLLCAFLVGLAPVIAGTRTLLRAGSAVALRRYAEPSVSLYAAAIVLLGYVWHDAVLGRPGASAVVAVEISALGGIWVGWATVRRASRAAAALLARYEVDRPRT